MTTSRHTVRHSPQISAITHTTLAGMQFLRLMLPRGRMVAVGLVAVKLKR